jgi:hypothetical protein
MGRRKGRKGNNKPQEIKYPALQHDPHCTCNRCLDASVDNVQEKILEASWEQYNRDHGITMPNITLSTKESPVVGPYDGDDEDNARFVTCPNAIVGYIIPKGRRRK